MGTAQAMLHCHQKRAGPSGDALAFPTTRSPPVHSTAGTDHTLPPTPHHFLYMSSALEAPPGTFRQPSTAPKTNDTNFINSLSARSHLCHTRTCSRTRINRMRPRAAAGGGAVGRNHACAHGRHTGVRRKGEGVRADRS